MWRGFSRVVDEGGRWWFRGDEEGGVLLGGGEGSGGEEVGERDARVDWGHASYILFLVSSRPAYA